MLGKFPIESMVDLSSQSSWSIQAIEVFDTHGADSDALVTFVSGLSGGSFVLMASMDESQSNMTQAAKDAGFATNWDLKVRGCCFFCKKVVLLCFFLLNQ